MFGLVLQYVLIGAITAVQDNITVNREVLNGGMWGSIIIYKAVEMSGITSMWGSITVEINWRLNRCAG